MAAKHQLKQSIYVLLKYNRDGSYETRGARKNILMQLADSLNQGGYKLKHIKGIKQKHICYLVKQWQESGLSTGTIKNRMSHVRWLCEHLNKPKVVPSNDDLGIGKRAYKTNVNKAFELTSSQLSKLADPYIKISLHLQRHLGLRREESLKIKPHIADKGDYLVLQPSWTKGGRGRIVPIATMEARYWLDEAKQLVQNPGQSLIPEHRNYKQHRDYYDKQIQKAGIKHAHGLRHAYAQERYKALAGWDAPVCGGPTPQQLTDEEKKIDRIARTELTEWLGHSRLTVLLNYLN